MLSEAVLWGRGSLGFSGSSSICRYKAGMTWNWVLLLASVFHQSVTEQRTSGDRDSFHIESW